MSGDHTTQMKTVPPVMVLGCGRSGTSIFGELFDGLAGYTYASEPPFETVLAADYARPQAFKVPRESHAHPARPGLSFPLQAFLDVAPAARIFWIVRHPLDAICSLRIGIARNWGHHPRPRDWRDWLSRPLIEQCAHHWDYLNRLGYAQVRDRATLVTFEAMIADPRAFATAICEAIGLNRTAMATATAPHLARWARRVQNVDSADFVEAATSRSYSRPDHTVRVERWRENLDEDKVRQAWPIVAETARAMGYATPWRVGDAEI